MRVRFAPSPTGYLHIGGARTVLFNWLLARKHGGKFILRIEDTDQGRNVHDSVAKILDDLRWLSLNYDEGPEIEGPYGPYFQSHRLDIYNRYLQQLLVSGHAYYALETPEQLAEMRENAKRERRAVTYTRPSPVPTVTEGEAARKTGRQVVVRLKMPGEAIAVTDDILGEVTLPADQNEDFVIQKGDGFPTYHFACVVDDELMKITHVLRGQEHLMNTPKHIALQHALGFATPRYAHLPIIFNKDGTKMGKRDKEKALAAGKQPPEIDVHDFRISGYLPEAVLNFIALLGWSAGDDRENYDLGELTREFSIERVGKTNARFDREKLLSFNTNWATRVTPQRLLEGFKDFLQCAANAPVAMRSADDSMLREVLRVCAGFRTFSDVVAKARFLFINDDAIEFDPQAVAKNLQKNDNAGFAMIVRVRSKLEPLSTWTPVEIDQTLQAICAETGSGMGGVAQPLRVAVTGSTVSPAIGETLALLGREHSLRRIDRCLQISR
jgi:glutamyl-tRNA synthetase